MGIDSALHTQTFQIEPDHEGGRTLTVEVPITSVDRPPEGGKKNKASVFRACLVIGFDTEYQSHPDIPAEEAREHQARNEVLSYQFSIRLLRADASDNGAIGCEGIVIPTSGERVRLSDFVTFAVGSLVGKFPTAVLPTNIYLVGHFTKADLPAFEGFAGTAKAFLANVRNTFVSVDNSVPLEIDHGEEGRSKFKIRVRDTILLAPAGCKKLADIGDMMRIEKIKLAESNEAERAIKEDMASFRVRDWKSFRAYAIRDAEICTVYAERLIRKNFDMFNQFKLPLTLTSFGLELVLQDWEAKGLSPDDVLGQEAIVEKKFSKKLGYSTKQTAHPFIDTVFYEEAFVTETYHGGRNEQFLFGIADHGRWRDHDLSSAYPTAMSLICCPQWDLLTINTDAQSFEPTDLAYLSVDFEFPKNVRFPTLPVRTNHGIIFPRRGRSLCAAPEYDLAARLGAKLDVRRTVHVPVDKTKPLFADFIKACLAERLKFEKKTFENLFWKEVGNSTYGKTAQGLRGKRVFDLQSDDMVELPSSRITQPFFASFITSFTRAVLGEVLNGFSPEVTVFSVTTDGFLSNASDHEIGRATAGPLFNRFAEARKDLAGDGDPLEIKHEIRRPVGWRTRGSATLVPGDGKDSYVLQKGGIKTNAEFTTAEENNHTLRQFFERTPESIVSYRSGITLKDMVRQDLDLTYHHVEKRLSMEFDWKRKPINPREVTAEFEGTAYQHLTYDTEPMMDAEEFNDWRDAWEKFAKKPFRNLKTLKDFEDFETYRLTKTFPDFAVTRYFRKDSGHINRCRRDLATAFKRHQAGFDIIRKRVRVTHLEFCAALEACGIPCKVSDLDNVRKNEFKPNQTVGSDRVVAALIKLRDEYFPELEIDKLLADGDPTKNQKPHVLLAAE